MKNKKYRKSGGVKNVETMLKRLKPCFFIWVAGFINVLNLSKKLSSLLLSPSLPLPCLAIR